MNNKLVKKDINMQEITENGIRVKAQNFQKLLHKKPDKKDVKVNEQAGNSLYLPISFVEMTLDEMFFGLWKTLNFKYTVIVNEIVYSIELHYFHPTHKEWLCRTGASAVPIQMKSKDKGGTGDITNVKDKYKNALVKDFPHGKASAITNAALSIGKIFGRDLNRKFEDQYNPLIRDEEKPEIEVIMENIITELDHYTGDDKDTIKQMCVDKKNAGEFDLKFAQGICDRIGMKL